MDSCIPYVCSQKIKPVPICNLGEKEVGRWICCSIYNGSDICHIRFIPFLMISGTVSDALTKHSPCSSISTNSSSSSSSHSGSWPSPLTSPVPSIELGLGIPSKSEDEESQANNRGTSSVREAKAAARARAKAAASNSSKLVCVDGRQLISRLTPVLDRQ